jgi:hypothetical protein
MKKVHLIGLAGLVVLAFAAVTASSASAVSQWLISGATVLTLTSVAVEGELSLSTLVLGINVATVDCPGIIDGSVGPAGENEETEVLNTAGELISSTPLVGLALLCTQLNNECPAGAGPAEVWPLNLPWLSQIELMVGAGTLEWLVHLFGDNGEPGYEVVCLNANGTVSAENTCTGLSSGALEMMAGPDPLIIYSAGEETEKANCTIGGNGAGDLEGTGLLVTLDGLDISWSDV